MTYFHPWTLRKTDADEFVKHASGLRHEDTTWQDALQTWLSGNVLCNEAKQYIGNFSSVHRVRPRDDDSEDGNSVDIVSDEELEISRASLKDALATRIGGKEEENKTDPEGGSRITKILHPPWKRIRRFGLRLSRMLTLKFPISLHPKP